MTTKKPGKPHCGCQASSTYQGLGLRLTKNDAVKIAPIIANAGLYNVFIAARLIWSVAAERNSLALNYFFLGCVAIAGIFGAATLNWKPLVLQTVPGADRSAIGLGRKQTGVAERPVFQ